MDFLAFLQNCTLRHAKILTYKIFLEKELTPHSWTVGPCCAYTRGKTEFSVLQVLIMAQADRGTEKIWKFTGCDVLGETKRDTDETTCCLWHPSTDMHPNMYQESWMLCHHSALLSIRPSGTTKNCPAPQNPFPCRPPLQKDTSVELLTGD